MSLLSVILTYLFAIPMSIVAARNEGKWQDQLWLTYNSITFGIPPYVFYLLIILSLVIVLIGFRQVGR